MADLITLRAEPRETGGKGPARAARRAGRVPGIIYGDGSPPVLISLDPRELAIESTKEGFFARLVSLDIGGTKLRAIPREVQVIPRPTSRSMSTSCASAPASRITVAVPVHFVDQEKSPGLRRGGILNVVRHDIELRCNGRRDPGPPDGEPRRARYRRQHSYQRRGAAARHAPDHHRAQLHHRLDRGADRGARGAASRSGRRRRRRRRRRRGRHGRRCRRPRCAGRRPRRGAGRPVPPLALPRRRRALRPPAAGQRRRAAVAHRPSPAAEPRPGAAHAPHRRARQSRQPLRAHAAQYRLHGGGRDRPLPPLRAVPRQVRQRLRRGRDRGCARLCG